LKITYVGEGNVMLIAGGGKTYTDLAARFVRSERSLAEIVASPYDQEIVNNIVNSGHKAAVEFDYFIFGVEGFSRTTEVQLVRKRIASYIIKSGRSKLGNRQYSVVMPKRIMNVKARVKIPVKSLFFKSGNDVSILIQDEFVYLDLNTIQILEILEEWYAQGIIMNLPEEDLRFMKPQATEFKALIGMNAHALLDWFTIRTCVNAQEEIRDMANKMLALCKQAAPDLFVNAGPSCKVLGYCPENDYQNKACASKIKTKVQALEILANY